MDVGRPEKPAPVRVVASATTAMTMGILPVFLLGATATQMRADLQFGKGALGVAVGVFFGAVSLTSILGGRLTERIGPRVGLCVSTATSAVVLTLVGVVTSSFGHLVVWMVIAGMACGLAVPGASLALVRGVHVRPGLMFGLNQSAPPAASLLAGVAVPIVAVEIGWRWTWGLGLVLGAIVFALLPPATAFSLPSAGSTMPRPRPGRSGFGILTTGVGFGSAAALSMASFFVTSAVDRGVDESTAGLLLAVGSVCGIAARLLAGLLADRRAHGHLDGVGGMMVIGAGALFVLALAHSPATMLFGVIVGYGFGYGWSGLLFFAVAHARPDAPALAIGMVNTGATAGGALGPAAFGYAASSLSLSVAWTAAAVAALVGGALVIVGARRVTAAAAAMAKAA